MRDPQTFETRLADAFERYADLAPVGADGSIAATAIAAGRGGVLSGLRWPVVGRRTMTWAALGLLLLGAVGAAVLIGSALDRTPRLPGKVTPIGPAGLAFDGGAAAMLNDGRVLLVGGAGESGTDGILDPATGALTPATSPMIERRTGFTATTLPNGLVLIAGGEHPGTNDGEATSTANAELFDPATGRFAPAGPMATARTRHTATLLADGRVLVVGGWVATGSSWDKLASAEVFDPSTGSWSSVGSMANPRDSFTATLLSDGRVLILGGWDGPGIGPDATAAVFDPSTGQFSMTNGMSIARGSHTATLMPDGRVLLVGDSPYGIGAHPELYDPATGSSVSLATLTTPRSGHSATLLLDGRVLIAGGTNQRGEPLSTELFDPSTGTFHVAASAARPHGANAVRLSDGRVLLADGQPEVFDPAGSTVVRETPARHDRVYTAAGPMATDRFGHTATRLTDGRVLIAGGFAASAGRQDNQPVRAAELFDPASGTFTHAGVLQLPPEEDGLALEGHVAVPTADGGALLLGEHRYSWSPQRWDPATRSFQAGNTLVEPARAVTERIVPVRLPDGRTIVVGPPLDGSPAGSVSVSELDAAGGSLMRLGDLERCGEALDVVATSDDRLVVLCGRAGVYASVRRFDLDLGAASGLELPLLNDVAWVVGLDDGRVLVASGSGETRLTVLDADSFTTTGAGSIGTPTLDPNALPGRTGLTLTRLADGRVLILGGAEAAVWDPDTNEATTIPGPLVARSGHTATLLDDGRVLLVGGTTWPADGNLPAPPGAEIFDPNALP